MEFFWLFLTILVAALFGFIVCIISVLPTIKRLKEENSWLRSELKSKKDQLGYI